MSTSNDTTGATGEPTLAELQAVAARLVQQTGDRETDARAVVDALGLISRMPGGIDEAIKQYQQDLAVPRYHKINGCTFFIDRDANLSIDEREGRRELVTLTVQEAYGLLTFLRLPGVAQLIEQVEAAEQDRMWHDFVSEEREEMTHDQALELLKTDELLMSRLVHITTEHALKHIDATEKEKAAE